MTLLSVRQGNCTDSVDKEADGSLIVSLMACINMTVSDKQSSHTKRSVFFLESLSDVWYSIDSPHNENA